jgi:hypothetical protein
MYAKCAHLCHHIRGGWIATIRAQIFTHAFRLYRDAVAMTTSIQPVCRML